MTSIRFSSIGALSDPAELATLLGPILSIECERMSTSTGYSGSSHDRLRVSLESGETRTLVLKQTDVTQDWLARRTGDSIGREALLLDEPGLAGVWEVFRSPYLAHAREGGRVGLLMHDLTDHLLPDVREPVTDHQELAILSHLASLHARYWESSILDLPWLARPEQLIGILHPAEVPGLFARDPSHPIYSRAHRGWPLAMSRLPSNVAALLTQPPETLAARCASLPRTLLHGDSKVANFGFFPDGGVAAFDWTHTAAGPVGVELGWYLAVNASRLTGSKDDAMARYRGLLEAALHRAIPEDQWNATISLAALGGAVMLLWSKALALESGTPRAAEEWEWYVERLSPS